ncbi:MAG: diguanylate cyclase domain-containing protein [Nitriliruptoraceae bacterium]
MDIQDLIRTGMGRRAVDGRSHATKRSLMAVSRSLEAIATQLALGGDDFAVVSLFEDAAYFAYEWDRYAELARHGRVVVGFAGVTGEVDLPAGIEQLPIPDDDPLADEWNVLVLSPAVSAGLIATDLGTVVAARTLERGRLFSPAVSTDPAWVVAEAERILAALPGEQREAVLAPGRAAVARAAVRGEEVLREELEAGWWRTLTFTARVERAERAALADPRIGALPRRFLEGYLSRVGSRAPDLAVVLFDLDGLHRINERYGRSVGDAAIQAFAEVVRTHVRGTDLLVRYDGDQWLLVVPSLPMAGAEARVDEILAAWARTRLPAPADHEELAASAGVGVFRAADLDVAAVDAAMYAAKAVGGGQRVSLPSTPPMGD